MGENAKNHDKTKRQRLFSFFDHIQQTNGTLIICGDLFEFWFEYKHVIPKHNFQVLYKLKQLSDASIEIHYLAGNHDFCIKGLFEQELGIKVYSTELTSSIGDKKLYVTHGDGLKKSDVGYRLLKKIIQHPLSKSLFRLFHPDFGIPIAHFMANISRESGFRQDDLDDIDYREFAEIKIAQGYDFVVLGHTHLASLQKLGNGWYINPGDWMYNFTFAKIEMGIPKLFTWDGLKSQPFKPQNL